MAMRLTLFSLFLFLCVCTLSVAARDAHRTSLLRSALEDYEIAVAGSPEAVEKTISRLEQLLKEDPDHFLARAHLGNSYTLKVRHVSLLSKRRWAERGFRELDAAVEGSEGNPEVRLMRAVNAYNLPKLLERHPVAQEDFRILMEGLRNKREPLSPELKKEILFHAGAFALKEDHANAIPLLEEAKAISEEASLDRRIEIMLRLARNRFEP